MRIGVDVRYLSHGLMGGVHTYVKHLVPALFDAAQQHQIVLYADSKRTFELATLPLHVTLRILPWRNVLSSVYHDAFIRREMARDNLDVVHFPANVGLGPGGVPTVITLHDALNIMSLKEILWRAMLRGHIKNLRTAAMTVYLHAWSTVAINRADLVVTDSQHARADILRHSKLSADRIVPVLHAASPELRRIEDPAILAEVRSRHKLPPAFVLADGLKNPAVIVRSWRRLPEEVKRDRRIVFFARRAEVLPVVTEAVRTGDASLLVRPDREDLVALYSMADAFLFPSWIEGFGLPVLEAMTCGAPVLASNRGSIPEVAGDAAVLIDAEDDRALADELLRLFNEPDTAIQLRRQGFERAAQFSWANTATQTLAAYEVAISRAKKSPEQSPLHARRRSAI